MKGHILRRVMVLLAVVGLLMAVPGAAIADEEQLSEEVEAIIDDQLDTHPGGTVDGNEIHYGDDLTFIAIDAETFSLSACPSGRFCGWAQSNFTGSLYSTSGSGVTRSLSWTARSYANKRSTVARLYNSSAAASTCFVPGRTRATIGTSYYSPSKVRLSSSATC